MNKATFRPNIPSCTIIHTNLKSMKRFLLILCSGLIYFTLSTNSTLAQTNEHEIIFSFPSADKLINTLESDVDKSVSFEISGLSTSKEADQLMQNFLGFSSLISGFTISDQKENGKRDGTLFLYRTIKTSYFTKLLITCGVRNIIVEKDQILTVDLNDKSKYFVK